MKKLLFLLISMMMLLFFACTREDDLLTDPSAQAGRLKTAHHGGEVFTVYPNGTDDTEALLEAFEDAKAAGPGSVVKLLEGEYTIGMIEVHDFKGFFRGAGRGKTIVSNLCCLPCEEEWIANTMPSLMEFVGGNVFLSDMTIRLADGKVCADGEINESMYGELACIIILADFNANYTPGNRQIKAMIQNVDFIAGNDGGYGIYETQGNAAMAIFCGSNVFYFESGSIPLSTGDITIRNCYFENNLVGPDFWAFDANSVIRVEHNTISGGLQQIFMGALAGPDVTILNNKFINGTFVDLFIKGSDWGCYPNAYPIPYGYITIKGNRFQSPPGVVSMYISDEYRITDPSSLPQLYAVFDNQFNTQDGECPAFLPWGNYGVLDGVMAIQALDIIDAKIVNNKFAGTGTAGVYMDGDEASGAYAENVKLIGNNYFNADYTIGSVYLGPFTKDCKVVGVKSDEVVDEGVNNSIIGVKAHKGGHHHGRPGHSIGHGNSMPGRPSPGKR